MTAKKPPYFKLSTCECLQEQNVRFDPFHWFYVLCYVRGQAKLLQLSQSILTVISMNISKSFVFNVFTILTFFFSGMIHSFIL